jgi:hypothetical protein
MTNDFLTTHLTNSAHLLKTIDDYVVPTVKLQYKIREILWTDPVQVLQYSEYSVSSLHFTQSTRFAGHIVGRSCLTGKYVKYKLQTTNRKQITPYNSARDDYYSTTVAARDSASNPCRVAPNHVWLVACGLEMSSS